jgi:PPK2 family polyphosphate:nucleotide phosphotransferase
MAKKRSRTVTMKMPGGPSLEVHVRKILVRPGSKIDLVKDYDPGYTAGYKDKQAAARKLAGNVQALAAYQEQLYAQDVYALLVIFQAMDAAGKDSAIKHVMSGVNPQGCQVVSFKSPSTEELSHDYLWRCTKALPERGRIGIFNRSYYEEVLVVRVHPEFLERQKLPPAARGDQIWKRRFEEINAFEKYLAANGILPVKFFLNVSKEEQRQRFLERIERPEKNWKFSVDDARERTYWDRYQAAYEDMLNHTSSEWAPWYVIPADKKWFTRLAVSEILINRLKALNLAYPVVSQARRGELREIGAVLKQEG